MFEEEVKKILDDEPIKMYPSIEDARRAIRKRHKELAHQICQLEPKPEYDASITQLPDPFELKAGRVMTETEQRDIVEPKADEGKDLEMSMPQHSLDEYILLCEKADAKTASIIREETFKVIENWLVRYCGFDPSDSDWQALMDIKDPMTAHHAKSNYVTHEGEKLICFEAGKLAGIREVVRDLAAIDRDANDVKDFTRRVCDLIVQWQAKLRL